MQYIMTQLVFAITKLAWRPALILALKIAGIYVRKSSSTTDDRIYDAVTKVIRAQVASPKKDVDPELLEEARKNISNQLLRRRNK